MASESDVEWLKSHPLSFEIIYALSVLKEPTPTKIADKLDRGLSTISEGLSRLVEETNLIPKPKQSEQDSRKWVYSLSKPNIVSDLLKSDELVQAYAENSSRLRKVPPILMEIFIDKINLELSDFSPKRDVWVLSVLGIESPTSTLKTSKGDIYLDVIRLLDREKNKIHEYIGKIIDVKYQSEENIKVLPLILLSPTFTQTNEEPIKDLIEKLGDEKLQIKPIIQFLDDISLVDSYTVHKISELIKDTINQFE